MLMPKKYFIFDLDNTLVRTNLANNNSYRDAIYAVTGVDVQIRRTRFTRADLPVLLPDLSDIQINEIIKLKESFYSNHIQETELNGELAKCLRVLKETDNETILLTESHKLRAQQLCDYYALTQFFSNKYYREDFGTSSKYQYLEALGVPFESIVLFENEHSEIRKAIYCGIKENQIIKVKF